MIFPNTPLINEEFLDILEHATNLAIDHQMTFIRHRDQNIFRLKSWQRSRNSYTISRTIYLHWYSLNFLLLLHSSTFLSQLIIALLLAHTQCILYYLHVLDGRKSFTTRSPLILMKYLLMSSQIGL